MSLPYHIGNGIFGGLLPTIALFLTSSAAIANANAVKLAQALPYAKPYLQGLWYPIIVAGLCLLIGAIYITNDKTNKHD